MTKSNDVVLPLGLLAVGGAGMFMSGSIGTTRSPFLLHMARDLDVDIVVLSHMLAGSAVAVGISSFFTGPLAERVGRRGLLVGALVVMAGMMAGSAVAWAYWQVLLTALLGGLASGIYMGSIYGEVGDRVADSQRGRAMGWLIGGQSLALLVGVPMASWIGAFLGWRGVSLIVGGCTGLVAGATLLLVRRIPGRAEAEFGKHLAPAFWRCWARASPSAFASAWWQPISRPTSNSRTT